MNYLAALIEKLNYGKQLRPQRDWLALLGVCGVLLVLSVAWNAWLFEEVKSGASISSAVLPASQTTGDEAALAQVQQAFAARATEEAKYETGGYTFVDPSQE